jgi:hypothetical protein
MRNEYKQKANNLISSVEGRIKLINYMIEGKKQPNQVEAKQYIREALNGLKKIEELISIS